MKMSSTQVGKEVGGVGSKCLVCYAPFTPPRKKVSFQCSSSSSLIDKQMKVMFILRRLLEVSSERLQLFLTCLGKPEEWVWVCPKCDESVEEALALHEELVRVEEKFKKVKGAIIEQVKESCGREEKNGPGSGWSQFGERMWITDQSRNFVMTHNYGPFKNPFVSGDSRARQLANRRKCVGETGWRNVKVLLRRITFPTPIEVDEEPPIKIETQTNDNDEPLDSHQTFEETSQFTPLQDEVDDDYEPEPSRSPNDSDFEDDDKDRAKSDDQEDDHSLATQEDDETGGVLELIRRVASRPLLFDPEHPLHKDKKELTKSWNEVAEGLRVGSEIRDVEWCKRKWKMLRDYYWRKKKEQVMVGEKHKMKTWKFRSAMRSVLDRDPVASNSQSTISNLGDDDETATATAPIQEIVDAAPAKDEEVVSKSTTEADALKVADITLQIDDEEDDDSETEGIFELIRRVASRPSLFDPEHPLHKDKKELTQSWNEVAEGLKVQFKIRSGEWCRKKWKMFKDYYMKQKREQKKRKITWPFYSAMHSVLHGVKTMKQVQEIQKLTVDQPSSEIVDAAAAKGVSSPSPLMSKSTIEAGPSKDADVTVQIEKEDDDDDEDESEVVFELIRRVANRPLLFDGKHPLHNDRDEMTKSWKEVAEGLRVGSVIPGEWCRKKWKMLKDYYLRKQKEQIKMSLKGLKMRRRWRFYSAVHSILHSQKEMGAPPKITGRRTRLLPGTRLICEICGYSCTSEYLMEHHKRKKHRINLLVCETCGLGCTTPANLSAHRQLHEEVREHLCDLCPKSFTTGKFETLCFHLSKCWRSLYHLRVHKDKHKGTPKFSCKYCAKAFYEKSRLIRHEQIHTNAKSKPYVCEICAKTFPVRNYLYIHMKSHRKKKVKEESVGII